MRQLIENHRVIVCTGSGGVGKTTLSAALGVLAARMGKRVLVLTIDPARRLATTLGIDQGADEVWVPGQRYAGSLHAGMIDQARIFAAYIRRNATDQATIDGLFNNALYQQLSTTLSGSQEFTSLSKLVDTASSGHYDLVILDTPPVAHAVDFLHAPEKFGAFGGLHHSSFGFGHGDSLKQVRIVPAPRVRVRPAAHRVLPLRERAGPCGRENVAVPFLAASSADTLATVPCGCNPPGRGRCKARSPCKARQ